MEKFYNTSKVTVEKYFKPYITVSGHQAEIVFSPTHNHDVSIKKLNDYEYMYIKNTKEHEKGEILEYNRTENRQENMKGIYGSIKKCSELINCNFFGEKNELFLTFTYKENMTDTKQLYTDLKIAIKNLRRHLKNQELLYILTVEPQGRGAWHAHILLKNLSWTSSEQWYLKNEWVKNKIWGNKGFVTVKSLEDKNNVGKYITTYLTDLKGGKKYSRLELYPNKLNLYRCSKNCKKPKKIKDKTFPDAIKELKKIWKVDKLPYPTWTNTCIFNEESSDYDIQISKIIINLDYIKPEDRGKEFNIDDYIGNPLKSDDPDIVKIKYDYLREKALKMINGVPVNIIC